MLTGAAAKKTKGKQRVGQHAGKKKKAEKAASKRKLGFGESSSEEEEHMFIFGEGDDSDEDDEEEAEEDVSDDELQPGQQEKGIFTVKRVIAKVEHDDGEMYLIDWEGWSLDEASWEPLSNLLTANAEVRSFEETLAAMPRVAAFDALSPSGCCMGKLCQFAEADGAGPVLDKCGSCGKPHHHMCASEAPWLKWITDDKIAGRRCFDCWLLESLLKKTAHPLQLAVYYKQVTDWSRAREMREPFVLGAFLATNAIPLQQVCN